MNISVKYFGLMAELFGKRDETIQLDNEVHLGTLKSILISRKKELKQFDFKLVVNLEVITDEKFLLSDRDEIALLPAYAGG